MPQSVINAFQKILKTVKAPPISGTFAEQFALRRFVKKFEVPDSNQSDARRLATFEQWVDYDSNLRSVNLPHGVWYKTRLKVHQILRDFRFGELAFTGGSGSEPLRGMQAIADKLLTHKWEVSDDCADLFVDLAIDDKAFLKAAKIRVKRSLGAEQYRATCRSIFNKRQSKTDVKKYILYACLVSRNASRFSTVRKNNEIDRSIDLQPFINMAVQRAIGLGLRDVLKKHFNVVLEELQPVHGLMIMDPRKATIDLKNASDSNSWSLIDFLAPKWFTQILRNACPTYTEGLDGHYHVTKKVSSMGNGFTFELMSLILTAAVREVDPLGSVFGDDIIIDNDHAEHFIEVLRSAGWVVNEGKSFINSPFRESCGYNYLDGVGYLRSYDFEWPMTIGDCVTFWNKAVLLSTIPFFQDLTQRLYRAIPKALRGPIPSGVSVGLTHKQNVELDLYFFDKKYKLESNAEFAYYALALNWDEWSYHESYIYKPTVRFSRRDNIKMSEHSLLYFTYMQSGRTSDINLTGVGGWIKVGFITNGSYSIRVKDLMYLNNDL